MIDKSGKQFSMLSVNSQHAQLLCSLVNHKKGQNKSKILVNIELIGAFFPIYMGIFSPIITIIPADVLRMNVRRASAGKILIKTVHIYI